MAESPLKNKSSAIWWRRYEITNVRTEEGLPSNAELVTRVLPSPLECCLMRATMQAYLNIGEYPHR